MNLESVIKACKKENLQAQSQLYQRYKDDLFLLCLKYCRNAEDAQDTLHDAFMDIFSNIQKYNGKGSFEGWMKRIAINKAIDKYKKEKPSKVIPKDDILEDLMVDEDDFNVPLEKLLGMIQELPSRYRLVFNLYEMDDYSHKEIAELLSISEGTSKSNLYRAKYILKNKINSINSSQYSKYDKHGN